MGLPGSLAYGSSLPASAGLTGAPGRRGQAGHRGCLGCSLGMVPLGGTSACLAGVTPGQLAGSQHPPGQGLPDFFFVAPEGTRKEAAEKQHIYWDPSLSFLPSFPLLFLLLSFFYFFFLTLA